MFPALHTPFRPALTVRSLADVLALETQPLAEALPVRSTYEIFRNSAAAFGDKTALTFLPDADPATPPIRWSYAQLLAGIHQTANLLHRLGLQADEAVAVLLPGCLDYHLALWGGEAAAIVQPLNPLLTDEKTASLMRAGRAKVLIAWGVEDGSGLWEKAQRLRALVPGLHTVLRVGPLDGGEDNFSRLRALEPDDHLVSGRVITPDDIAAYFHTGGTTGAPDAYAGELPVVFATLRPGCSADEAELLAFTAAHVDEPPAKPRWVKIIDSMPMTNVGKIYKPELREMAAALMAEQRDEKK